jgi:hypothetical protein
MPILLGCVPFVCGCRQQPEDWVRFDDPKTELSGFKDAAGKVRVPAKFSRVEANRFGRIIAVSERVTADSTSEYYLLRDGRKVGLDSLYVWDMTYDCESENKVRFRDPVTDKVGFFDGQGNVVVPARYNDAAPFHNGLALVIQGAARICWEGGAFSARNPCEHWSWKGGKTLLINEANQVLVEFAAREDVYHLDWYSLEKTDRPGRAPGRKYFKGKDGRYYSFVNVEEQFESWFYDAFLPAVTSSAGRLEDYCFGELAVSADFDDEFRGQLPAPVFVQRYATPLLQRFREIDRAGKNVAIFREALNPFIFEGERYAAYYNNCGAFKTELYPVFNVVVSHYARERLDYQEHFEFIRMAEGYRLIRIAIEQPKQP